MFKEGKLLKKEEYIFNECLHFLDELQYSVEKRNRDDFEFMVSDAKDLANFFHRMIQDLKEWERLNKKQKKENQDDMLEL